MQRIGAHLSLLTLAACLVLFPGVLAAQEPGTRQYEEELRTRLDEQGFQKRDTGVTGGGWFDFALFRFDDASTRRTRTLRLYELRAWAAANYEGVHRAYVRGVVGWDDWNPGDNGFHGDEDTDPQIERAWYEFNLGQLQKNQTGRDPDVRFKVRVGRDYARIGTALVLSTPMDMVVMEAATKDWEAMAFLGTPPENTPNIDDSFPVSSHERRCFYGGQITYTGLPHHRPFVYFLDNEDHTKPRPDLAGQGFDYTSRYLGVGSTGNVVLPTLRYRTELAWEFGHTVADLSRDHEDPICAMAFDALLEYMVPVQTHPTVMVEYLYASGDSDRRTSATATFGGNREGTIDHAFNAFGYRDTGLAFNPRLSNLHIYAAGAGFRPLEHIDLFRKMELGSKVLFFQKATESGPISDTTATGGSPWLGWEWDLYCNWRVTSDLAWTIRYGAFLPGEAFEDRSCRQFLCTGMTFSF